jgi:carbon storage regulator
MFKPGGIEAAVWPDWHAVCMTNGSNLAVRLDGRRLTALSVRLACRGAIPPHKEAAIMLVLSRRVSESVYVGDDIVVTVCEVRKGRVRLGISAPARVHIVRQELLQRTAQADSRQSTLDFALTPLTTDRVAPTERASDCVTSREVTDTPHLAATMPCQTQC